MFDWKSCGFCGTDIHLMDDGRMADFIVTEPLVIGHETSARVIAVGKNVTNLKVGDRVAVETAIPCQTCEYCRDGKYNLCPISNTQARAWMSSTLLRTSVRFLIQECEYCRDGKYNLCPISNTQARGLPPKHGCLRRYYAHPSDFLFKLPDSVSWEEGAMCEPFSSYQVRTSAELYSRPVLHNQTPRPRYPYYRKNTRFRKPRLFHKYTDLNKIRLALADKLGVDKSYAIDPKTFNDVEMAQTIIKDMGCNPDI
ncbi:unnamed protein product, partial [Oppiella nova]